MPPYATNVSFVPGPDSITVTWRVPGSLEYSGRTNDDNVIRKISLRRFSQENVTQLYVLEDFNSTASASNEERGRGASR